MNTCRTDDVPPTKEIVHPGAEDGGTHTLLPLWAQAVTKAEAATLISMLEDGVRPDAAYINAMGRGSIPVSNLRFPKMLRN